MADYPPRKTLIDGNWDDWGDTINLQNWLKAIGYYAQARVIDADWGYWTTRGLQAYLRTKTTPGYPVRAVYGGKLDGDFGPLTRRAMADAAFYVLETNYIQGYCAGGACTVSWPHAGVVKGWQLFLNNNT